MILPRRAAREKITKMLLGGRKRLETKNPTRYRDSSVNP